MRRPLSRLALALGIGAILPAALLGQSGDGSVTVSAHSAFDTGAPFSALQTLALRTVEVTWMAAVHAGRTWTVQLPVSVVPVALMLHNPVSPLDFSDGRWWLEIEPGRSTSLGVGVKPLGVRVARSFGPVALELGVSCGVIYFDRPTPGANSERLNAMGDLDLALQVPVHGRIAGIVGYRLSHISNAGRGSVNPGVDSHMLSVGIRR